MKKITDSPWFTRLLALFFALLLFVNANAENRSTFVAVGPSNDATVENVPIDLKYDQTKYYVSGYEESTTVQLRSANKVLLDMESNMQTRNFTIEADLTKYQEGTYEIPLSIRNLNSAVSATMNPQSVHVTIEKIKTAKFKVEPVIGDGVVAEGYELGEVTVDPETVEVTSGKDIINEISKVIATVSEPVGATKDFSRQADLLALDKDGKPLDIKPQQVTVSVGIKPKTEHKTVKLNFVQAGVNAKGVRDYQFYSPIKEIEISGDESSLAPISSVDVFVVVNQITKTVTQDFEVTLPKGVTANPAAVSVTVTPILETEESQTTPSNSGNGSGSSTTKEQTDETSAKQTSTTSTKETNSP